MWDQSHMDDSPGLLGRMQALRGCRPRMEVAATRTMWGCCKGREETTSRDRPSPAACRMRCISQVRLGHYQHVHGSIDLAFHDRDLPGPGAPPLHPPSVRQPLHVMPHLTALVGVPSGARSAAPAWESCARSPPPPCTPLCRWRRKLIDGPGGCSRMNNPQIPPPIPMPTSCRRQQS